MNNYSHNQIFIQNTYCSFLESKKNEKTFGATQAPSPGALAEQGKGSTKNNRQKGFEKFWLKTICFVFLFFLLHKRTTVSSASEFENDVLKHLT